MAQFIPAKITPPQELPRVSRARLLLSLGESMAGCNSTVIQGRAGTGKTMLAADFARRSGRRAAWYKIDAPEAEPRSFLQYLCASVAARRPGFGQKSLALLGPAPSAENVSAFAEHFVYELQESAEPLLVVIDDLHLIYDAEWMVPFFGRLLPLVPPEVHICLLGRSLPPTPLWRMRSKQTLCVLDESALAFTLGEARSLFASYGLPGEQAEAALIQTRGRASTLDACARAVAREASGRNADASAAPEGPPLRLVKGFRKSSLGAV